MEHTNRPSVGVAVAILRGDTVLLGRRKTVHGLGYWAFPGGHLEFGENIEDCARREVLEETGLQIANLRYGPYTNDIFDETQKHYVTLFVVADYISGAPEVREPEKTEPWEWFSWDSLPEPLFLPIRNLQERRIDLKALIECPGISRSALRPIGQAGDFSKSPNVRSRRS